MARSRRAAALVRIVVWTAFVLIVVAGVTVLVMQVQRHFGGEAQPPLRITGIYADDWLDNCGRLDGAEQAACANRLDQKYGRAEAQPVPKAAP